MIIYPQHEEYWVRLTVSTTTSARTIISYTYAKTHTSMSDSTYGSDP